MTCHDSVCTSQNAHAASTATTSGLMMFREIMTVCIKKHMKDVSTLCGSQRYQVQISAQTLVILTEVSVGFISASRKMSRQYLKFGA
jgi:hypothetical protein